MADIVIILILIFLNGLFSMSEVAMINARKTALAAEAKNGSRSAQRALDLVEDPGRFLSTVQIGITLIGILTGLFSGAQFADTFSAYIQSWGCPAGSADVISRVIIVAVATYLSIVIGELFPKKLGLSMSEKIARIMSGPMWTLSVLCTPIVWLLRKGTDALGAVTGVDDVEEAKVTEEEIRSMVAEGTEDGEVQEVEQDIVDRVFSLGDRTVESIMTSRNDIVWLDKNMGADEVSAMVNENLFEMYPVGEGGLDEIVGVVFLRDLFAGLRNSDFKLADLIKPAQFFHDNMDVYKALEMMKKNQTGYGIVCDEFGICQGIVTYKDILEGLVGSIDDVLTPRPGLSRRRKVRGEVTAVWHGDRVLVRREDGD